MKIFILTFFNTILNFILISRNVYKKMKPTGFALHRLCEPIQGQGHRKWYKILEGNGAHKHIRYEKNWLKSVCAMLNGKVSAMKVGQVYGQLNTTHFIDP